MREPVDRRVGDKAAGAGPSDDALRREARLADALRANLKRRKDQRRERDMDDTSGRDGTLPRDRDSDVV